MRTDSARRHLSCTTVLTEAKYDGQSLQEARTGGLIYTLCRNLLYTSLTSILGVSIYDINLPMETHLPAM